MDEEKIFGPLTFRQFLYAAGGVALCYLAYTNLELKVSIPVIIIVAGIFLAIILNAPKVVIDENYIKMKKVHSKNPEEFERWVQQKIAMIQSQISIRKEKGFSSDPKLQSMLELFESVLKQK